ncbi:hypothetical protein [Pseudoalteromonas sp. SaAl2]
MRTFLLFKEDKIANVNHKDGSSGGGSLFSLLMLLVGALVLKQYKPKY